MQSSRRGPGLKALALLTAVLCVALTGCSASSSATRQQTGEDIRIASYDFSENQALAALYAEQLRRSGFHAVLISALGTREIVEPALEQRRIDLVLDYLGTAVDFVSRGEAGSHGDPDAVHRALVERLAGRGITALAYAPGEDQNGFAVTQRLATARQLSRLSDLRAIAPTLVFGGPPECPIRTYCLQGLQQRYGLRFRAVRSMPSREATVTALQSGEIDVGMLETTDARLGVGGPVLLTDDLGLQPRENIVPLVRSATLQSLGPGLSASVDSLTRQLTTDRLRALNRLVEVDHLTPAQAAVRFLERGLR